MNEDDAPTWEIIEQAIFRRLWNLAPDDFRQYGHKDIVFGVTMQDMTAAVTRGIDDAYSWCKTCEGPCRDD